MTKETIDIQEAYDALCRNQMELQEAFMTFASWAGTLIAINDELDLPFTAEQFKGFAEQSGQRLTAQTGSKQRDNPWLLALAGSFKNLAEGKTFSPFSVIDGGKPDETES